MKIPWGDYVRAVVVIVFLVIAPLVDAFALAMRGQYGDAVFMAGIAAGVVIWMFVTARLGYRQAMKTWRMETGICVQCGYDLRSSPERCPECGTMTPWGKKTQQEA